MYDEKQGALRDKLTLLYVLDQVGACTEAQLLRINDALSLIDPFQFFIVLGELKESRFIEERLNAGEKLLWMTEDGKSSLEMFQDEIWPSKKMRIDHVSKEWKAIIREELQIPASWIKKDGRYVVTMKLIEGEQPIFDLSVTAADKQQAIEFCERWPKHASFIYKTVMEKLGEPDNAAP
ncbi:MAG: DUF4364 family protein [Clostridia bacterium]|nr:DUF4364 family protein [Clostridia bacterium]